MPTTISQVRDRMIELIVAIVPTTLIADRFRGSLDEDEADFMADVQAAPEGALRRFQVRDTGARRPPDVSNTDVTADLVTFEILVAYPQTARAGAGEARDRDRMMGEDTKAIDRAVGLHGYANFGPTTPAPASWVDGSAVRATSDGLDFLVIRVVMRLYQTA